MRPSLHPHRPLRLAAIALLLLVMGGGIGGAPAARAGARSAAPAGGAAAESPAAIRAQLDRGEYGAGVAGARRWLARHPPATGLARAEALELVARALLDDTDYKNPEVAATLEQALAVRRRLAPHDSLGLSHAWLLQGRLALGKSDLAAAAALIQLAVRIIQADPHATLDDRVEALQRLARLVSRQGKPSAALDALNRSLALQEAAGVDAWARGRTLMLIADAYLETRRLAPTDSVLTRVEALQAAGTALQAAGGPDHEIERIALLTDRSIVRRYQGDLAAADRGLTRVLEVLTARLRPGHAQRAFAMNSLGDLKRELGDYGEARRLMEEALGIWRVEFGDAHPNVAGQLTNLGGLYEAMGDDAAALRARRESLLIRGRTLGTHHPDYAQSLNNMALSLMAIDRHADADTALREAISIWTAAYGPDNPRVARAHTNRGEALFALDRRLAARAEYDTAIAIMERGAGADFPGLALPLLGLARLDLIDGRLAEAEREQRRANALQGASLGPDNPQIAFDQGSLARILAAQGRWNEAVDLALQAEALYRRHQALAIQCLSEREALGYTHLRSTNSDLLVSLAVRGGAAVAPRLADIWDTLQRSRDLVFDEMTERRRLSLGASSPGVDALQAELVAARQKLAGLLLGGGAASGGAPNVEAARRQTEQLERTLADRSAPYRRSWQHEKQSLAAIVRALPPGAALVGVQRYEDYADARLYGIAENYAAFVARPGQPVRILPLGDVTPLDDATARWLESSAALAGAADAAAEVTCRAAGEATRRRLYDPLAAALKGAGLVFIVPDGVVNFVNFAALPDARGGYLIESGPTFHRLTAERDLLDDGAPPAEGTAGRLLAVGSVAFDSSGVAGAAGELAGAPPAGAPVFRGATVDCEDFRTLRFAPLPGTAGELVDIGRIWRSGGGTGAGCVSLSGRAASEEAIRRLAPLVTTLHLSTHGFFIDGACGTPDSTRRGIGGLKPHLGIEKLASPHATAQNPLQLSGLALAGANLRRARTGDEDDGILTAEEIATLDLSNLDWAVLSACDTGVGQVAAGEGVMGLQRAFHLAGARSVIMSLWAVGDESTRAWMRELYQARRVDHATTAESVRRAGRAILKARRAQGLSTHPFFWGGFVAAGGWR